MTNITGAIKVVETGRTCSMHSGVCAHRVSVGKPEGKTRQGVPTIRKKVNGKTDLKDTRCEKVDWIELEQNRAHRTV
jgi:hypothetical protein